MTLNARIRKAFPASVGSINDQANSLAGSGFVLEVDFKAPPGVTILFGASGAGKTQTLKALAGLVLPDKGFVSVDDEVLFDSERRINLPASRRRAGYVFQNLALFPHMTAIENVEFGAGNMPRKKRSTKAAALLERFGVGHVALRRPRDISGGEAQRVALARTLASDPRMLLLDEPLSALDESIKLEIIADLKKLNSNLRLPILYVTHSRDEALVLGERALIFEHGRIIAEGEPHEVFTAPVTSSVARLTGVENIFTGPVLSRSEADGTLTVELYGIKGVACRIEVPLARTRKGGRVTIGVRSGDILLATEEPRKISARNVFEGCVARIEQRSEQTLVQVESGVVWIASVTRQSLRDLQIEVGKTVWLAFKTHSCRILDDE